MIEPSLSVGCPSVSMTPTLFLSGNIRLTSLFIAASILVVNVGFIELTRSLRLDNVLIVTSSLSAKTCAV